MGEISLNQKGLFDKLNEFFLINVGLLLVAAGIVFFKAPNKFATGGVSGIAIIVNNFFPGAPVGLLMLIINVALLGLGLWVIGFGFGTKTTYSTIALAGMVWGLQRLFPLKHSLTGDMMLELLFGIFLPAIGSAIIFNCNASTGGTDIVAKILSKYTHLHIGKTLLISDFLIAVVAGATFGIKIGMYSVLGLVMKAFLVDLVIEGLNISKYIIIICSKPEAVKEYIVNALHRGATVYRATGAFTSEEKQVITTVVNRRQAIKLRSFVREVDPSSFVTISNVSEIVGKGFRNADI